MTFERMKIRGEKLGQLIDLVEPLIQDLDLEFPVRIDTSLLVDEERDIYYLSFFTGSGFLSPAEKFILEKEGPYYFDGYENNPVTPYHWPAVQAIVTPNHAFLFTTFEFSKASAQERKASSEFYVSSLSIKSLTDTNIIHIKSEAEVPKEIHELIQEAINVYEQRENWIITTQLYYNFGVNMLKNLHTYDWMDGPC